MTNTDHIRDESFYDGYIHEILNSFLLLYSIQKEKKLAKIQDGLKLLLVTIRCLLSRLTD